LPEVTQVVAASSEFDCKRVCIEDLFCAAYERNPTTKECKIFTGIDKLQADDTDDDEATCVVKVSQQMLTEIVTSQRTTIEPKQEGEICLEEADCEKTLQCAVYQRIDPSTANQAGKSDDVLANWNKDKRTCIRQRDCESTVESGELQDWALRRCQQVPGSIGPDRPCIDTSECYLDYSCAKGVLEVPADATDDTKKSYRDEQENIDEVGKTCYLSALCDTVTEVNGFQTRIECESLRNVSTSRRRRRLNIGQNDIQLKSLAAGCYATPNSSSPTTDGCTCHDSCTACGFTESDGESDTTGVATGQAE